ncbi:MAG: M20/M25/M40 family metallo-hydrolase [Candidatus Sumerlaeota bacterium]|nr:M20/M25/M40 family metallo-hydrolase [Candidatus Sumerlaeota bacterium]
MTPKQLNELAQRVDAYIEARKEHFNAWLVGLIQFETVGGDPSKEGQERFQRELKRCLAYIEQEAQRLGMDFRLYGGKAAVAELKGASTDAGAIGVAGHVDVVPPGDGWSHPPFGGDIADGAIWGRGTQDDKGAIAVTLAAIECLKAAGVEPAKGVRLLIGTQEETSDWSDVDLLIEKDEVPSFVLVPDGSFPIINGEKGMITIELKASWDDSAALRDNTTAPSTSSTVSTASSLTASSPNDKSSAGLRLLSLASGQRVNMVPDQAVLRLAATEANADDAFEQLDKAAIRLMKRSPDAALEMEPENGGQGASHLQSVFNIVFHGRTAHGAHPQAGHNAALDALQFLDELGGWPAPMAAFIRFLGERACLLDASGFGLACHHDHLKDTTVNLGLLDLKPREASASLNLRFPLGLTAAEIIVRFEALARELAASAPGLTIKTETAGKYFEPLFVSPKSHSRLLTALKRAYETGSGREARFSSLAGTTYAKAFPLAVVFGPVDSSAGEEEMCHKPDERVAIARYLENIKIYALALALLTQQ